MTDTKGRIFFIRAVREAAVHVFKTADIQTLSEHWSTVEVEFSQVVINLN